MLANRQKNQYTFSWFYSKSKIRYKYNVPFNFIFIFLQKGTEDSITAAVQALNLGDLESDTESINTPSTSPSHRGRNSNRDSDISFGLHSPEGMVTTGSAQEALQVSVYHYTKHYFLAVVRYATCGVLMCDLVKVLNIFFEGCILIVWMKRTIRHSS